MPLRIFRIRNLSGADSMMLFLTAALYSVFFFTTLYLQEILGYSPVKTGFSFLVIPVVIGITATNVPRVIQRIGYKPILMIAPLFVAAGLFWVSHIPVNGTFWGNVAPGMILMGLGMGATFVSVTIAATSGVPQHESGLASGLLNTSQQIGGSVGLAILTGISTTATAKYIKGLNLHGAPTSYDKASAAVHGYHDGYLVAAGFAVIASLIATIVIKNIRAKADPSHGETVSLAH
jgi:MFS family permease